MFHQLPTEIIDNILLFCDNYIRADLRCKRTNKLKKGMLDIGNKLCLESSKHVDDTNNSITYIVNKKYTEDLYGYFFKIINSKDINYQWIKVSSW